MSIEHDLLTRWIGASAMLEADRRRLNEAQERFNMQKTEVDRIEAEIYKLAPERGTRKLLFKGQLIEISRRTGMGSIDSVYATDVEEIKE